MLTGICTARVTVHDWVYPVYFIIINVCSCDVSLGMDFLSQHNAVIDLKSKSIMLSTKQVIPPDEIFSHHALSVLEN